MLSITVRRTLTLLNQLGAVQSINGVGSKIDVYKRQLLMTVLSPMGSMGEKLLTELLCPAATTTAPVLISNFSFYPFNSPVSSSKADGSTRSHPGTSPAVLWVWISFSFFHHRPLDSVIYHSKGISEILGDST